MKIRHCLNQVPQTRADLSFALLQSLEILQMTHQELSIWLEEEIVKNPLLELNQRSISNDQPNEPAEIPSLYQLLKQQIRHSFEKKEERQIAEEFIEHLDERGFLSSSLEKLASSLNISYQQAETILKTIQTFHPPGIGAQNLQETLLIQLSLLGESKSFLYSIIQNYFDDLIHGRYAIIKKKTGISHENLHISLKLLKRLSFWPSDRLKESVNHSLLPDLRLYKSDLGWAVEIVEEGFPTIQIRSDYLSQVDQFSLDEKKIFRFWLTGAKWLIRSINRRRNLIYSIASHLVKLQSPFFEQEGPLAKIDVEDLATLTGVHPSTIHRALSGKIIEAPWGLIPLRSLLFQAAEIKSHKAILQQLIQQENRATPLTDQELAAALKRKGIDLARRTVSKYRRELKIETASKRKIHDCLFKNSSR